MARHGERQEEGARQTRVLPAEAVTAVTREIERLMNQPLARGLYLVATPIGNLGDITLRALAVLARADYVYCEDTRSSRTLLSRYGIGAALRTYHEHNAETQRPQVLAELAAGQAVALISDAGTPLVSDPGWKLVREALAAGHAVTGIPGPSAPIAALAGAGLPTDAFFFAGFLPPKAAARRARIAELARVPGTLIFFEAPSRAGGALADLASVLGPRQGAVARELTKLHEEIVRGSLEELAAAYADRELKGEVVILAGPPMESEVADSTIESLLSRSLTDMSLRDASKAVADALGVPKARVYDLALKLKQASDGKSGP